MTQVIQPVETRSSGSLLTGGSAFQARADLDGFLLKNVSTVVEPRPHVRLEVITMAHAMPRNLSRSEVRQLQMNPIRIPVPNGIFHLRHPQLVECVAYPNQFSVVG